MVLPSDSVITYVSMISAKPKTTWLLKPPCNTCLVNKQAYAQAALMVTSTGLEFLEGHEADECDCPACLPACERTGRKCFITCDRCRVKVEADDIGPLKSVTKRVQYAATAVRPIVIQVSPELREFMNLLKTIEAQVEAAGLK